MSWKEKLKRILSGFFTINKTNIINQQQIYFVGDKYKEEIFKKPILEFKKGEEQIKINANTSHVISRNGKEVKANFFIDGASFIEGNNFKYIQGKELSAARKMILSKKEVPETLETAKRLIINLNKEKTSYNKIYLTFDYKMEENSKKEFLSDLASFTSRGRYASKYTVKLYFKDNLNEYLVKKEKGKYSPIIYKGKNNKKQIVESFPSTGLETYYVGHVKAKEDNLCFYDKLLETNSPDFEGNLRIELALKKNNAKMLLNYKRGEITKDALCVWFSEKIREMIDFKHCTEPKQLHNIYTNETAYFWEKFLLEFSLACKTAEDIDAVCTEVAEKIALPLEEYSFIEPPKSKT